MFITGLIKSAAVTPTTLGTTLGILGGLSHGARAAYVAGTHNPSVDKKKLILGSLLAGALTGGGLGYLGGSAVDNVIDRFSGVGPGYEKRKKRDKEDKDTEKKAMVTPTLLSTLGGGLTGALVGGGIGDATRSWADHVSGDNKGKAYLGALIGALAGGGLGWVNGQLFDNLLDRVTKQGPGSKARDLQGAGYEIAYNKALREAEEEDKKEDK